VEVPCFLVRFLSCYARIGWKPPAFYAVPELLCPNWWKPPAFYAVPELLCSRWWKPPALAGGSSASALRRRCVSWFNFFRLRFSAGGEGFRGLKPRSLFSASSAGLKSSFPRINPPHQSNRGFAGDPGNAGASAQRRAHAFRLQLRTREFQQWRVVVIVSRMQRFDVAPSNIACMLQIYASPCEAFTAQAHDEQVRH
jgi:hypothetical protein